MAEYNRGTLLCSMVRQVKGGEDAPFFLLTESVVPGKGNALTRQKGRRNPVKGVEGLAQTQLEAGPSGRIGGALLRAI